jgi:hypothetical protein
MDVVLSRCALNRATLARQLLSTGTDRPALDVVRTWSGCRGRIRSCRTSACGTGFRAFQHEDLSRLLHAREVVRGTLFRGTQHVLAADDYVWVRPLLQPMLDTGGGAGSAGTSTASTRPRSPGGPIRSRTGR